MHFEKLDRILWKYKGERYCKNIKGVNDYYLISRPLLILRFFFFFLQILTNVDVDWIIVIDMQIVLITQEALRVNVSMDMQEMEELVSD